MAFFDYFRRAPKSASLAKDRLSIIVARERAAGTRGGPDYLPQLQQELLAVIAKYEKIDLSTRDREPRPQRRLRHARAQHRPPRRSRGGAPAFLAPGHRVTAVA